MGPCRQWSESAKARFISRHSRDSRVPLLEVTDEDLWELLSAFADEWQGADEAGKEKLEIRFAAQFPELVRDTGK